jgi:MspA
MRDRLRHRLRRPHQLKPGIKIDGCVGQSLVRSYAVLTHETEMSEAVLAWYGTTNCLTAV